jgi:hypothetical protein
MAHHPRKELFQFMIDQVHALAKDSHRKDWQAFIEWFLILYFGLEPNPVIESPDGAGDGKIDAVFRPARRQKTLVLVNSKYTENFDIIAPPAFYDEIRTFNSAFNDTVTREAYLKSVRANLRAEYRSYFKRYDDGDVELIFLTNYRKNWKQVDSIELAMRVKLIHLDDILQFMQDFIEGAMPLTDDLLLNAVGNILTSPQSESGLKTYVMFVNLQDFIKYMEDDEFQLLFARNIRLDLETTEVNKAIEKTFSRHPEEFAYSNNGITILCESLCPETKHRYLLSNPRVVNGSQTLHTVFNSKARPSNAHVMVKIVEIPRARQDQFAEDTKFRKEAIAIISERTNLQNSVTKAELRSNEDRQHEIGRAFRRHQLYYERRRNEWKLRKLKLQAVRVSRGPQLKALVQMGAAYLWRQIGPAKARSSVKRLFDDAIYEAIMDISPDKFVKIYSTQLLMESAMWNARLDSSNRRRDLLHNGRFAMFSLFTKATQLADVRIEDWPDPEDEINEKRID